MKKLSLKAQVNICVAFVWIGALVALMSKFYGTWCLLLGIAILLAAAVCRYSLIRCPHCGHKLTEGKTVPPRCPNCKGELR